MAVQDIIKERRFLDMKKADLRKEIKAEGFNVFSDTQELTINIFNGNDTTWEFYPVTQIGCWYRGGKLSTISFSFEDNCDWLKVESALEELFSIQLQKESLEYIHDYDDRDIFYRESAEDFLPICEVFTKNQNIILVEFRKRRSVCLSTALKKTDKN